mmetsp:Transcript_10534/g.26581  ORF Transcript_10534/g.26581 Transcript_10534/m.26581 type:complete len:584 (+) Transcript_10534:79-1830(+)
MEPCYQSILNPAWLVDKPRTSTVAWNKFLAANSCFCLFGFRQLAHRAGRSMSGLRDSDSDSDSDNPGSFCKAITNRNPNRSCCSYESFHGFVDSVVSDVTEGEFLCLVQDDDYDGGEGHYHYHCSSSMIDLPPIRRHSIKGFPPKPQPKPWSGSSCNRSFVTTGSSFCSVASSSKRTIDSSSTRHKRALPMHYNDNYQVCVEEALNEPRSPWRMQQQQQQQQHYLVVEKRSRLDSEISALEMESQTGDGRAKNEIAGNENHDSSDNDDDDEDEDEDSMGNSPFPLLQHKGNEDWSPISLSSSSLPSSHRKVFPERKPLQSLPPPPPPPARRHSLVGIPKNGRTTKKHTFRRRTRRRQSEPLEMQRRMNSSEPTDFLFKNAILEECPLLLPKTTNSEMYEQRRKVVVSGWIVVLFGETAVDRSSSLSGSGSSASSLSLGFGPGDLYYLRIVQDSSVSLVLHRSTDGRQEHLLPIDSGWVVESNESQDRRVGRSVSVSFSGNCLRMIPVALQDAYKVVLDRRIRAKSDRRIRERQLQRQLLRASESIATVFVLPQHGRFAPDAQLDTARHLFFTIDSFAKQQQQL